MRKYLFLIKTHISLATTYRVDLMWAWVYRLITMAVAYTLWSLTTNDQSELDKLLQYFALYYLILEPLATGKSANWLSKSIQRGELSSYLIRPIYYPATILIQLISVFIARLIVPLLIFILGIIFMPEVFAPDTLMNVILFIIFIVIGILTWNFFMLCMGSVSFWGTEIGHLLTVIDLSLNILKGQIIPTYLFSEKLNTILSFTPIPYFASFPIQMYQTETITQMVLKGLVISLFWLVFFFVLFKIIYRKGISIYEAAGA